MNQKNVNQEDTGIPYSEKPLPETNFDDIYTVLLASQKMALENYRLHIAAANKEREDRAKMVDFSPAAGQITITEQEYLTKAIEARQLFDDIGVSLKGITLAEEKFAFGAMKLANNDATGAQVEFDLSSSAMKMAADRIDQFASYCKKAPLLSKVVNKLTSSKIEVNTYELGYAFGAQLNAFSKSMNSLSQSIQKFPKKAIAYSNEKAITLAQSVKEIGRTFYSRATQFFSRSAEQTTDTVLNANDRVQKSVNSAQETIWTVLSKYDDYLEEFDARYAEKKANIRSLSAGVANVVAGAAKDAVSPVPRLKDKIIGLGVSLMTQVHSAGERASQRFEEGATKARRELPKP